LFLVLAQPGYPGLKGHKTVVVAVVVVVVVVVVFCRKLETYCCSYRLIGTLVTIVASETGLAM